MKILFAIKNLNTAKGGAERVLTQIANGLLEHGHEISVLSFDPPGGESYYPLAKEIKRVSIEIGNANKPSGLRDMIERIQALHNHLKTQKPDIAIGFMHSMFVPLSFAAFKTAVPVIASEHIVPAHYKTRPHEFLLLMLSSFFVKKMTVLSKSIRRSYPFFITGKMVVMPNPVEIIKPVAKTPINPNRHVILNVGRLDRQKDQATLIRAFAKIALKYKDWDLRIIGEGPLRTDLEELIETVGLKSRITLPGTTRNIAQEYINAEIFALPSLYESFGLATAEAMYCGLPAVGFAECPGTNELIQHEVNGLLISKKRAHPDTGFAHALEALIKDTELRAELGANAQESVKKYKPENIINRWNDLIVEVCGKKSDRNA